MPEPADRPPCLRDRIAAAVLGFHGRTGADASDRALAYGTADAVLPVVEAETARVEADTLTALTAARDQRHRAEKAERERDTAREALDAAAIVIASLRDQRDDASKRAEEAEARLRRYDTAIADERRDKLAAEAAVRRGREIHRRDDSSPHGPWCDTCLTPWPCRTYTALDAEGRQDEALDLLREFVHDTPCDPHPGNGFCQTHAHRPPCPHAAAKELLAAEQPSRAECGDYDPAVAMTNPMTAPPAEYLDAEQPKETR